MKTQTCPDCGIVSTPESQARVHKIGRCADCKREAEAHARRRFKERIAASGVLCAVNGCVRTPEAAGICGMHAKRKRATGSYGPAGPLKMHGLDRRQLKPPKFCTVPGCEKKHKARGYCDMHTMRLRTTGDIGPAGSLRRAWGTGGISQGYIIIKVNGKPIAEHRHVMERILGRPLVKGENVHHINGVRDDNRPENLELWNTTQPSGQRVPDKVAWALELLELYAPDQLARNTLFAAS